MGDSNSAGNPRVAPVEGNPVGSVLYDRTSTTEESSQRTIEPVHTISQEIRDDFNGSSTATQIAKKPDIAPPEQSGRDLFEWDDSAGGIEGSSVFRVVASYNLRPITELSGKVFLRVWWHIVSERNLMYYRNAKGVAVGVLNDYDLASTNEGQQGNKRMGTIPFMAIELLDHEGFEGHITHQYRHDAESLVWVLAWVTLHYVHGTRLPRKDRPLEAWQSLQAPECGVKKSAFVLRGRLRIVPPPSQKRNWQVVMRSLKMLNAHYSQDGDKDHDEDEEEEEDEDENENEDQDEDVDEGSDENQDEHEHQLVVLTVEEVFRKWLHHEVLRKSLRRGRMNVRG
ncbi:hypothetical protein BV22DRAFT_1134261 [Leucogyrophana mollusca]|uniref:Uncharacterized protein n=1 Tax=Leucogyrophana mollusca TaxID=85980 RepID=A0ACB8AZN6_9AGAM|nr:hypothetical protein BV22DRAFT_1134261 [Leucogyrophana mollusca]